MEHKLQLQQFRILKNRSSCIGEQRNLRSMCEEKLTVTEKTGGNKVDGQKCVEQAVLVKTSVVSLLQTISPDVIVKSTTATMKC